MQEELEAVPLRSTTWHILLSFGAFDTITSFFTPLDVIAFQTLNFWMYARGVARVQARFSTVPLSYFFAHVDYYTFKKNALLHEMR